MWVAARLAGMIWAVLVITGCAGGNDNSEVEKEVSTDNKTTMSGCDSSCMRSCCMYPDKETNGCLCARKGKDCVSTCCAVHEEGGGHGGGRKHEHDSAHSHHTHQ
jgi:hypothetical protein